MEVGSRKLGNVSLFQGNKDECVGKSSKVVDETLR